MIKPGKEINIHNGDYIYKNYAIDRIRIDIIDVIITFYEWTLARMIWPPINIL
jgi:hypothetical protein